MWSTERFAQYWMYPAWPCWYRQRGPGAKPEVVDQVLGGLPFKKYFVMDPVTTLSLPMVVVIYSFSALIRCVPLVGEWYCKRGYGFGYLFRPRKHILHGNAMPSVHPVTQFCVLSGLVAGLWMFVKAR